MHYNRIPLIHHNRIPLIPPFRYSLYHETEAGDVFMLSARRRKKSKNSNYLLSLDQVDLSRKSANCVGKVRPASCRFPQRCFGLIVSPAGSRQYVGHRLQRVRRRYEP